MTPFGPGWEVALVQWNGDSVGNLNGNRTRRHIAGEDKRPDHGSVAGHSLRRQRMERGARPAVVGLGGFEDEGPPS